MSSCAAKQQPTAASEEAEEEASEPGPERNSTYQDKDAVSEKGKKWGGWRYQGSREDCFYTVKRKCFTEKKDACKAAGCPGKACTGKSGAPIKVSCKK